MKKLTPAELAAPDVYLKVGIERWGSLPVDLQLELEPYCTGDAITFLYFRLPEYEFKDLLNAYEMQLGDKK